MNQLFNTTLVAAMLTLSIGSINEVTAQDAPDVNFITQTTSRITMPDDVDEDEFWKMQQEYFDKVLTKSTLVKHYTIYRHHWGSEGSTIVTALEFATWGDIDKFNTDGERQKLEAAAWPDEKARKTFLKKLASFTDPYHKDEIYNISNTMRK